MIRHLVPMLLALCAATVHAQTYVDATATARTGFGTAIVIGDGEIFVDWPHWTPFSPLQGPLRPGDVLVYRRGDRGWEQATSLSADDGTPDNRFGRSMAVRGHRLLLGATKQDDDQGAAYLFERTPTGTWRRVTRLVPPDTTGLRSYGRAVGLVGEYAFVTTAARDSGRGIAYTFKRDRAGVWRADTPLVPGDLSPNSYFGLALAVESDLLAVGAPFADDGAGAVYLYRHDRAADAWRPAGRVTAAGDSTRARFGMALAVMGGRVLVGAPGFDGNRGAVFAFAPDGSGGWTRTRDLTASDGAAGHQFGQSVAASGGTIWIGAPRAAEGEGRVYDFTGADERIVGAPGLGRNDFFGNVVALRGDVAAVAIGNDDFGEGAVVVLERRGDDWLAVTTLRTESGGLEPVVGRTVECADGGAASWACDQVDLAAFLPVQAMGGGRGVQVNDVWGWTDAQTGREFALVGRFDGTAFVDVTNPTDPVYLGDLGLHEGAAGNVWRDIKVYRDHAFIVSDGAGAHGMQVFDLTALRDVRNPPATFAETAHYGEIGSAHNIVIDEETGFAYAVGVNAGGETCGGGLHMIDVRQPAAPTFAGCFSDPRTGYASTGYTHDAMCVVYRGPDTTYTGHEVCFNANETALSIADVTDKQAPTAVSIATYPTVSYAHQGWITEDHRYFFLDDEGDELDGTTDRTRTLIFDVTDLDDPVLVREFLGTTAASDHNLYIRGPVMYQSNYVAGLRIIDISDPLTPREVGFFDTVPGADAPGFAGSWSNYPFFASGTILVTSGAEGLFVLRRQPSLIP